MGNWYEQSESNATPDGVTVTCLPSRTREVTESLVAGGGWRQLSNQQIIPGSMRLVCPADAEMSCTDADLHGHSTIPGGTPRVDHALGKVKLPSATLAYEVTYSVPSSSGRMIRQLEYGEPITPSMMPFSGDSSNKVCWAVEYAQRLGRRLLFQGELFSHIVELYSGMKVDGKLVMNTPALLNRMRINGGSPDPRWGYENRLDQALARGVPHITCKSGATELTFGDFEVDGWRQSDSFWDKVLNSPSCWNAGEVRNSFQNSPVGAGISFTTQSGRVVKDLRVRADRLYVHDMPGSCCVSDVAVDWFVNWLRIGSSFCGRPYYELVGTFLNVELEGHSRTSMARIASGTKIHTLTYRSLNLNNPASPDAEQKNVLGASDARGDAETYLPNLDIDLRGSKMEIGLTLGVSGYFAGKIHGGGLDFNSSATGALKAKVDLDVIDGAPPPLSFPSGNGQANWSMLDLSLRLRRETKPPTLVAPLSVRVKRNSNHPAGHTQTIYVRLQNDNPCLGMFWFPDLGGLQPQDCVPTTVFIEGGTFDVKRVQLVSVNEAYDNMHWPQNIGAYPIRIYAHGCRLNPVKPGVPSDNTYASQFALLKLINCESLDGRLIDPVKLIDGSWWGTP